MIESAKVFRWPCVGCYTSGEKLKFISCFKISGWSCRSTRHEGTSTREEGSRETVLRSVVKWQDFTKLWYSGAYQGRSTQISAGL